MKGKSKFVQPGALEVANKKRLRSQGLPHAANKKRLRSQGLPQPGALETPPSPTHVTPSPHDHVTDPPPTHETPPSPTHVTPSPHDHVTNPPPTHETPPLPTHVTPSPTHATLTHDIPYLGSGDDDVDDDVDEDVDEELNITDVVLYIFCFSKVDVWIKLLTLELCIFCILSL